MVKQINAKQVSLPVGIAIGILISAVISVISATLLAGLVDAETMQLDALMPAIAVVHLIATFVGAWISYLLTKQMRLLVSAITAGGYLIILCGMTALIFDGQYEGFWPTLLMVLIGMVLSILPGIKGRKGHIRKHKIPAYR